MSRHYSAEDWIDEIPAHQDMLANRLKKRDRHLRKWANKQEISAYRLYDHDIPEIPIYLERYNDALSLSWKMPVVLQDTHTAPERHPWFRAMRATIADTLNVSPRHIHARVRRPTRHKTQYERQNTQQERMVVQEGNARFYVNMVDYVDTGLFLDHRPSRLDLQQKAKGKRVLNLFGYTGAFAVHAAIGGASSTLSLDLSTRYTSWTEDNYRLNRIQVGKNHQAQAVDVMDWLQRSGWQHAPFDWIVLDPPTTSKSKRMAGTFDVQRDQLWLLERCRDLLAPHGTLLFSTNYRRFRLDPDAAALFGQIEETTARTVPEDFPYSHPHRSWRCQK